jgi:class 3 adenylate cyclase/tetratricopeptide (TPR) repeat protein
VACGQDNPEGARFCNGCGGPLRKADGAEVRKTVTVVFCDLVGSTALGERTDPEVLRGLMGRYHASLRQVIELHGGTVEKFIGDAVMAVFGIPRVHEDDAIRAVRAALAMRDAVAALDMHVRIGINTGEVVTGTGETLVTGDAVNVAARLEQSARTDEILIGEMTQLLVGAVLTAEPVQALTVKGKSAPLRAYRVTAAAATAALRTASPFVGRRTELDRLEAALTTAVNKRVPQLATVVGAPGIGKSRLVSELLSRVDARVLVGRCLSYGDAITYWPLVEILHELGDVEAGLAGEDDADLISLRLAAAAGEAGASASPEEIAWAFRRLLERLSRDQPVVVVLDDVHWAEPALLDLVEYVVTFAQDAPALVLCTARSELFETRPEWAAPRPDTTLVKLDALSPAYAESLVDALGELPPDTRARIVDAADGNPLFVEQLVAMQAETGGELQIPPSLQALLAARIDRLEVEERLVIERASVEGRLFHRGAVMELLPEQHRRDVANRLLSLVRRELVRPDRAVLRGDDGFRFGHMLIRDAAYESMPKRVRAELHERYADWLVARLAKQAPPEIVGYHLEQAHLYGVELGLADPDVAARASSALATAADEAYVRDDARAAAKLYSRAAATADERHRPALLVRQGRALQEIASWVESRAVLEDTIRQAAAVGDDRAATLARLVLATGGFHTDPTAAVDAAFSEAEAAIAAASVVDDEVLAHAWAVIAKTHLVRGRMRDQMAAIARALEHARAAGDRRLEIDLATGPGPAIAFGPVSVDEGLGLIDEMEQRFPDVAPVQGFAMHLRAHLRARQGAFEGNSDQLRVWRTQLRELGNDLLFAATAQCVWDVEMLAGDVAAAEAALLEVDPVFAAGGDQWGRASGCVLLAECRYLQGDPDGAAQWLLRFEEAQASPDDFDVLSRAAAVRARLLADAGDFDAAEALAREATETADRTEFLDTRGDCHVHRAMVLRAAGSAGADDEIRTAIALYEQKGNLVAARRTARLLP